LKGIPQDKKKDHPEETNTRYSDSKKKIKEGVLSAIGSL
jgi:hypothetical protein